MGSSSYSYEVVSSAFNEDFYEQCVIEHMTEELGYTHLYGPDVPPHLRGIPRCVPARNS